MGSYSKGIAVRGFAFVPAPDGRCSSALASSAVLAGSAACAMAGEFHGVTCAPIMGLMVKMAARPAVMGNSPSRAAFWFPRDRCDGSCGGWTGCASGYLTTDVKSVATLLSRTIPYQ
jgi:hypothetical protein